MLVAASLLFAVLLLYVLFVGYLPTKQRVLGLERELRELYVREAELQTRLQQQALRERQLAALSAERDALIKRLEALERELAAARDSLTPPPSCTGLGYAMTRRTPPSRSHSHYSTPSSFSFVSRRPTEIRRWPGKPTSAPSRTSRPARKSLSLSATASGTFTSRKFACDGGNV